MFPYIAEQKTEGSKKTIFIKPSVGIVEKILIAALIAFLYVLSVVLGGFSFAEKVRLFILAIIASPFFISLITWHYKGRVRITKDIATGSLTIEKGIFKLESYVFKKKEDPDVRLIGLDVSVLIWDKWPYILIINSEDRRKRIMIDPGGPLEGRLTKWARWNVLRGYKWIFFGHIWGFSEKDAKTISDFLGIPFAVTKRDRFLELKEYYDPNSVQK